MAHTCVYILGLNKRSANCPYREGKSEKKSRRFSENFDCRCRRFSMFAEFNKSDDNHEA